MVGQPASLRALTTEQRQEQERSLMLAILRNHPGVTSRPEVVAFRSGLSLVAGDDIPSLAEVSIFLF